jgi:hypothetical protein
MRCIRAMLLSVPAFKVEDVVILLKGKQMASLETLNVVTSLIAAYRYCHGLLGRDASKADAALQSAFQQVGRDRVVLRTRNALTQRGNRGSPKRSA